MRASSQTMLVGPAPAVHHGMSSSSRNYLVLCCLALPLVQSALFDRGYSLLVAVCAVAGSVLAELLVGRGPMLRRVQAGTGFVQGLLFALVLPASIPLYIPFLSSLAAGILAKQVFGGSGSSWVPVPLFALLFARFAWPSSFASGPDASLLYQMESFREALVKEGLVNPLDILKVSGFKPSVFDSTIIRFVNRHILRGLSAELPFGYVDLLFLNDPGALIADRGGFALLLVSPLVMAARLSRFRISILYLFTYLLLVFIADPLLYGQNTESFAALFTPGRGGDILFALFSGGTLLCAVFLVQDTAISGATLPGSGILAVIGALLSFLLRNVLHIPSGMLFALMLMALVALPLRYFETQLRARARMAKRRLRS